MRAHQIFQNITAETGQKIIDFLREEDRDTYRATLASLASQRKLRPVFIQRKSRPEQAAWMLKNLQLRQCDGVCEHLLQTWLMKGFQDVLVKYLDGVGIEHDGKGEVETLPDEIDAAMLQSAADSLLGEYDPELISIYLHTFNLQRPGGWESLTALLTSDSRLHLGGEMREKAAVASPPAKAEPAPAAPPVGKAEPEESAGDEAEARGGGEEE